MPQMGVGRALKVCLLALEYPPHVYGGAGVHVRHLTRAMANLAEVEVRTLDQGPPEALEGVEVRCYSPSLAGTGGPMKVLETLSWNLALVADPITADVVHAHTWYTDLAGALAKELYGIPLVATAHSLEPLRPWKEGQLGRGYQLSTWMERRGLEACDRIIAVSEGMKNDLRRVYDIPQDRISVIHNGVDVGRFVPTHDPLTLEKMGVRKPYVLFLGRLTRQKGIFDLLDAASTLPPGLQVVCVTGRADLPEDEAEMARRVKGHPNVVWVHRMLPEEEAIHLYSDCQAFVCPSVYEPFGIINLEAMACGRPVVATRVGGIPEVVIDGETGVLVPPSDPQALARAIEGVLGDPLRGEALGRAGRRRVEEHFSWEAVALRTLRVYESLL